MSTLRAVSAAGPLAIAIFLACGTDAAAAPPAPGDVCRGYPFAHGPARRVLTVDHLRALLRDVVNRFFANELRGYRVGLATFRSKADFMKSGVRPLTVLRAARKRDYLVYVNEKLLRDAPSDDALRAILVHEAKHVVDYTRMSRVKFLAWAAKYATTPQATYERQTDLAPLQKGLGCGLMEYREWLYRRVDAKTRALKQRNYYTPAEIAAYMVAAPHP